MLGSPRMEIVCGAFDAAMFGIARGALPPPEPVLELDEVGSRILALQSRRRDGEKQWRCWRFQFSRHCSQLENLGGVSLLGLGSLGCYAAHRVTPDIG